VACRIALPVRDKGGRGARRFGVFEMTGISALAGRDVIWARCHDRKSRKSNRGLGEASGKPHALPTGCRLDSMRPPLQTTISMRPLHAEAFWPGLGGNIHIDNFALVLGRPDLLFYFSQPVSDAVHLLN
jgi:hypothetical protein